MSNGPSFRKSTTITSSPSDHSPRRLRSLCQLRQLTLAIRLELLCDSSLALRCVFSLRSVNRIAEQQCALSKRIEWCGQAFEAFGTNAIDASAFQPVDANDLGLGHLLVGKADALTTHATIFKAAERHGIEAVIRRVVDHDAAGVDAARGL